ncbi:MAG TPA: sigma-70 family RNA polymerase sigma factor [Vicinamibacterales bacterium]|nr:sigma-70 family RNA polymerase sigma factor [Vicinamibacterales bacterium]
MVRADPELVRLALAGSQDASRQLVERHARAVYNLVARVVRDDGVAEELTQEAFLKAFRALGSFDPAYKFSTWVLRIAHNLAIDHLRRVRPILVPIDDWSGSENPGDVLVDARAPSPLDHALRRDLRADLEAALSRLRPAFRSLVVMRYLEDLSYEEIALATGLPLGTVKSHLHRARAALARLMAESGWGPEPARTPGPVQPDPGSGA